jgi:phosphoadenosine phosphosulfate reductase
MSAELVRRIGGATPAERLATLREAVTGRIVLTTSFGLEDQVVTHAIARAGLDIEIVTLDTGRLFPETYETWARTQARYGLRIRAFYPERDEIEAHVAAHGIDGFYDSREVRERCCAIRKVAPLARALDGAAAWVTGLRAGQSATRADVRLARWDEARGLIKVAPLFDWTREEALDFARRENVPLNPLHDRGFPSIGCAPCTRAVAPGEDERSGRWWWEQGAKECGLHVGADGRLTRRQAA